MKRLIQSVSLAVLFLAAAPLFGQTGPGIGSQNLPAVQPVPTGSTVTEASLEAYLRSIGTVAVSEFSLSDKKSSGKQFKTTIKRSDWTYVVRIKVYRDSILLCCDLGSPMASVNNLPAGVLARMLEMHEKVAPSQFSVWKTSDGRFQLYLRGDIIRPVSLERFKDELNWFLGDIRDTYPVWKDVASTQSAAK